MGQIYLRTADFSILRTKRVSMTLHRQIFPLDGLLLIYNLNRSNDSRQSISLAALPFKQLLK